MTYCSAEDMEKRFSRHELVQLTDREGVGVIDTNVLSAAINDASHLINGYLGGRYALPLSVIPSVLVKLCADIARYNLYDNAVPEVVEKHHKTALDFLKAVSKGEVRLGLNQDNESTTSDEHIEMQSGKRVFGRDNNGFI